ncbi:hypothetical protein [Streptomyces sp. CB03911]|uniref:hypothetical protein n=1 Tax=Streptomyces sp. CB03911 TaxID=1804758 RepID=UPI00093A17F0|nr:hypothetical protein [Streptomyces sp. CB03911]OKI19313.1 hypothetical protein A6A07_07370 [Streptomyces sp. CB03911]
MAATYVGRYNGIGRLLQSPAVQLATAKAAERMKPIAESIAPVGDPATDPHPGQYKASFVVQPATVNVPFRGKPRLRAASRLVNTARHATKVEFGNGPTQRYAVLRRTIDAARVSS